MKYIVVRISDGKETSWSSLNLGAQSPNGLPMLPTVRSIFKTMEEAGSTQWSCRVNEYYIEKGE